MGAKKKHTQKTDRRPRASSRCKGPGTVLHCKAQRRHPSFVTRITAGQAVTAAHGQTQYAAFPRHRTAKHGRSQGAGAKGSAPLPWGLWAPVGRSSTLLAVTFRKQITDYKMFYRQITDGKTEYKTNRGPF